MDMCVGVCDCTVFLKEREWGLELVEWWWLDCLISVSLSKYCQFSAHCFLSDFLPKVHMHSKWQVIYLELMALKRHATTRRAARLSLTAPLSDDGRWWLVGRQVLIPPRTAVAPAAAAGVTVPAVFIHSTDSPATLLIHIPSVWKPNNSHFLTNHHNNNNNKKKRGAKESATEKEKEKIITVRSYTSQQGMKYLQLSFSKGFYWVHVFFFF